MNWQKTSDQRAAKISGLDTTRLFFMGLLKCQVYVNRLQIIQEQNEGITGDIALISPEIIRKVMDAYSLGIDCCFIRQGCHIEQIL